MSVSLDYLSEVLGIIARHNIPFEGDEAMAIHCATQHVEEAKQLERARIAVASDPRNAPFDDWQRSVLAGEHDYHPEVMNALGGFLRDGLNK